MELARSAGLTFEDEVSLGWPPYHGPVESGRPSLLRPGAWQPTNPCPHAPSRHPQGTFLLPSESVLLGSGTFGDVFAVPCGGDGAPMMALKISELTSQRAAQQAVREASLHDLLPACAGLSLASNTWATWAIPREVGLPSAEEEGEDGGGDRPRPLILQLMPLAKGETLTCMCEKVRGGRQ